jgi:hypothetical protein
MGFLMTKAQTHLSSSTLDPPASPGCICVCAKATLNLPRTVLTSKNLTAPVSTVFHGHLIFTQMSFPAALRLIQSP